MNKDLKQVFTNVVWIMIAGYFVYHMISGARGVVAWQQLKDEVEHLEQQREQLRSENRLLENRISRLRLDNLDLDLLEEEAQKILGFFHPNDQIVLLPKE